MIREFNFETRPEFTIKYQKKMIQDCFKERGNMEFITFIKSDKKHITALIRVNENKGA